MANQTGIKLLVVAAVVAAGYFGISAYLRPTAIVQTVAGGKVAKAVSAQIKVRAENSQELKLEATGRMLNELKEGQAVAENDTLVEIDTRAKRNEIELKEIALTSARARNEVNKRSRQSALRREQENLKIKLAEKEAGRLSKLLYDQAADQVEQLQLKQETDQIEADEEIARIENSIKTTRVELENMTLKASWAGTLTNIQASKSALINGGQTIATLITNTRIIEARISEENMAKGVDVGQRVRVWFTGVQGDYAGTVRKILPAQDPQTLRYIAHLDLEINPAKLDKTGLSGEGVITIDVKDARVVVPQRALYNNRLYVVKDGRVEIRAPKLGYESDSIVEILSGLEPGEEVILDKQDLFHDGDRVRTQPAPAAK
jgi:multidrug efflux pump subunit AcrA (membrane-fusion protein)